MDSLLHNVFTDLALQYFLVLYTVFGIIALIAAGVGIWLSDDTRDDDLPDDATTLDPYAIAYLRGGAVQVARLAIYDLTERGILELSAPKRRFALFAPARKLRRNTAADISTLTEIQRVAWDWARVPRLPSQMTHRHLGLINAIGTRCDLCTVPLEEHRLLETRNIKRARTTVAWLLLVLLTGAGMYRLIAHVITDGRESLSLLLPMTAWFVCTAIICRPVRLSNRGQRYLEHLSLELGDWNHASLVDEATSSKGRTSDQVHSDRLFRAALFGDFTPVNGQRPRGPGDRAEHELVGA